jgi:hypothetical protein
MALVTRSCLIELERQLRADDGAATDRFDQDLAHPRHARRVQRVLRRHRHHHPFEQLHAVVRREHAVVDEGEVALDREESDRVASRLGGRDCPRPSR